MNEPSIDNVLTRAVDMIDPSRCSHPDTSGGFVDVLDSAPAPTPTVAQMAMNSSLLAAVYESAWRPVFGFAMGLGSLSQRDERERAVRDMQLEGEKKVLDVACGPGNFTRYLSDRLEGGGLAVGFDISVPMIERAVRDNTGPRAAYVRGDARSLPYADNTFDAVCCYAALYLVPEPMAVFADMMRVLKPGGRISILTTYSRSFLPVRLALKAGAMPSGIRMFDKSEFPKVLRRSGYDDIDQEIHGIAQFVGGTKS